MLTLPSAVDRRGEHRIVFYRKGFMNWLKPDLETYGIYAMGMMGLLPDYCRAWGFDVEFIDKLPDNRVSAKCILVLINQKEPHAPETITFIRDFVLQGGRLLLIGDHTFLSSEGEDVQNALLSFTDIRFNFDSANFFVGGWLHAYRYLPTFMSAGIPRTYNHFGVVIGASVKARGSAYPFLVGKYGFSDSGILEKSNSGYLGDMEYEHGERLGDLTLGAAQLVGSGRVLVVGDTTPFSNSLLPHSHDFVRRCFHWLKARSGGTPIGPVAALLCVGLILGGARIASGRSLAVLLASLPLGVWSELGARAPKELKRLLLTGPVAAIDLGHSPKVSLEGGRALGTTAIMRTAYRLGFTPILDPEPLRREWLEPSRSVLFVPSPQQVLHASYVRHLFRYARQGGVAIVSGGWAQRKSHRHLLKALGLRMMPVPLGPTSVTYRPAIRALSFRNPYPMEVTDRHTQILLSVQNGAIAVLRPLGRGAIVYISDERFLVNENLELGGSYAIGNVVFLKDLIERRWIAK